MAIHHVQVTSYSRTSGQDAVGRAAYRSGSAMTDERTKKEYDFRGKENITHSEIVFPAEFPAEAPRNREQFWNWVESVETRANANTSKEIQFSLPIELPAEERLQLAREFTRELVDRFGFAADLNIHNDPGNPHAHVQVSTRRFRGGKLEKVREMDTLKSGAVAGIREAWAEHVNKALARAGSNARIYASKQLQKQAETDKPILVLNQAQAMLNDMKTGSRQKAMHLASVKMQIINTGTANTQKPMPPAQIQHNYPRVGR